MGKQKPTGYHTEGRGIDRKVHPHFDPKGKRIPKSKFADASRDDVHAIHRKRSVKARQIDEKLRAKEAETNKEWIKQPNRRDIKGVDYPQRKESTQVKRYRLWVERLEKNGMRDPENPNKTLPPNHPLTKHQIALRKLDLAEARGKISVSEYRRRHEQLEKQKPKTSQKQIEPTVCAVCANAATPNNSVKYDGWRIHKGYCLEKYKGGKKSPVTLTKTRSSFRVGDKLIYKPQPLESNPVTVEDYPYGWRQRTQARYWVETTKRGQRTVFQTKNPKTGKWNKPKKSTYSDIVVLYKNTENNHVENDGLSFAYTDQEEYNDFVKKYPPEHLSEKQREKLAFMRAVLRTRKHLKVSIVSNPSPKEQERIAKNEKETMSTLRKVHAVYYKEEKEKM